MKSPVLLLIFKREDTTRRVFERIREVRPSRLYIAADGPRKDRPDEYAKCMATRKVVEQVDWPCEVHRLYREENLGCGKGVSSAITWFFEHEEEGVILEDDILPHIDFFQYCDELLEKYRDRHDVHCIDGHCTLNRDIASDSSYYLSTIMEIWGWATWKRVWDTYRYNARDYRLTKLVARTLHRYPISMAIYVFWSLFKMRVGRPLDTWDYQFLFNMIYHDRYAVSPYRSLTENIGFGKDATHTAGRSLGLQEPHPMGVLPLVHPLVDEWNPEADTESMRCSGLYSKNVLTFIPRSIWKVLKNRFKR